MCIRDRTYGVLSPILVRPGKVPGRYQLVAGERRLRASKEAGLNIIPVLIDTKDDDGGARTLAIQLVENMQRSNLTALEKAHAIGALRDAYELSIREVAERLGVSKSSVQRSLDVLDLPDDLINALRQGVAESKVLTLAKIDDPKLRAELLAEVDSLSRKDLEVSVKTKKKPAKSAKKKPLSPEDLRIVDEMQRAIGLKVSLARSSQNMESGKLTIDFYSDSDLQHLFRSLVAKS